MLASSTLAAGLVLLTPASGAQGAAPVQDPAALARAFAQRLHTHPYFRHVELKWVEDHPPFLFLMQTGAKDPTRPKLLAELYAELLAPTLELFRSELVAPLELAQRADQPLVVAVLASPGAHEDYRRAMNMPSSHLEAQGFYDRELNAAVLYDDPSQRLRGRELELSSRHLFLHVCQAAWYAGEGNAPLESWIMEGLACELARRDPEGAIAPDAEDLSSFLHDLADERRSWSHARTSEELCTVSDPHQLADFFQAHAPARPAPDELAPVGWAFYRQAALFLHFLLEGEARRHRAACLAFLKQAFAGHGDFPSFAQSFQPTSASELDSAFVAWALRVHQATAAAKPPTGQTALDPALVQKALRRGASSESPAPAASPASSPASAAAPHPAPAPVITVPPLVLDLSGASADERFALALYELDRGRARAGLLALEGLVRAAPDAAMRERAERERRRAVAWIELRDEFLRQRLESGEEIWFTNRVNGNRLTPQVLAFADGMLRFDTNRAPGHLSADDIDPFELAQQIKVEDGARGWVRVYPYVLRGDPKAKKLLEDDGGEGGALLADLRADYPARLRLGAVLGRLGELATRKPPTTAKELRANLDELAAWRSDAEGLPVLEHKRAALQEHARSLLARELELRAPASLLRGKLETRKGDVVRLTYEFDDPRELEDFSSEPYPSQARKALGAESSPDLPFQVQAGGLVGQGQASLRSLLDLAAPLSVRYELKWGEAAVATPNFSCALGICDDGREHFLWAVGLGHLQRYDLQDKDHAGGEEVLLFTGTPYAMELRHDGTKATLHCDGKEARGLGAGSRQAGAFFLCTASDAPVRFERVQIDGRLTPDAFERLKRAWIERGMALY